MPSTVIKHFSYDAPSRTLAVIFTTGRRYRFHDVPLETFEAMKAAFAKGSFFNRQVRGRYRHTEEAPEPASGPGMKKDL